MPIYDIIKSLHIVFVVTWFAGLFYIVRLFIYSKEAFDLEDQNKSKILIDQYTIMKKRLWFGITWPSAILTLVFGLILSSYYFNNLPNWLLLKFLILIFLYLYHYSCHIIYQQQLSNNYKFSAYTLRIWNEVATLFLFSIVFIVELKSNISFKLILFGCIFLALLLLFSIKIYAKKRKKN